MTALGQRFEDALRYAARVHDGQTRKGSDVPYVAHLLAVASMVLTDDGDEDQAIAGLLHDAAEDQGGRERLEDIRARYGDRVAGIVEACSDTLEDPKPPWRPRKERFLARIREERDPGVLRVEIADKVDNARQLLRDLRDVGDGVWDRFNAPKPDQLWYYRSLVEALRAGAGGRRLDELDALVTEIERLSGAREAD